ncbi:hypothetical protein OIU85_000011 [Salix viminalis]|uniref:DYW domain-containing protein n=1 Tax=Salix viminalis TaxID=40686 RepID=A0A9Q0VJA1_SALVM|nr:hypothetical protein OIU85_000011 [Salix viminalis]
MELGGYAAELIFEVDSHYPGNRVLLYNVYALAGRWNGAAEVRKTGREAELKYRSENLALAFALLIASPGSTIRISKNIRVCDDLPFRIQVCAQDGEREITVRDTDRFHHFRDGSCSCGDYW